MHGYIYIKIFMKSDYDVEFCRNFVIECEDVEAKIKEYDDAESGLIRIETDSEFIIYVLKYDYEKYWKGYLTNKIVKSNISSINYSEMNSKVDVRLE